MRPLQRGIAIFPSVPTVSTVRHPRHLAGAPRRSPGRIIDAGTGTGRSAAFQALSGAAVGHVNVVVPANGVGAVEMTVSDRVSQLDVRRVGDNRLVVRLKLRTIPPGYK